MLDVRRYTSRSRHFDEIIARTNEHFWDPDDADYINFAEAWNDEEPLLPLEFIPELQSAVADRLDEARKIAFANESTRWTLSNILHGEQGALNLSSSLCDLFVDPGAQEYAANQVREEARHVHGFTNYMVARFGGQVIPVADTINNLLRELVSTDVIYKKLVGMQMLVEGVAMGAFATLHVKSRDPLLRRLCQLTMTDEAFHHKFGKIWAHATIPNLSEEQANEVEDWALECFQLLLFNLVNAEQKRAIYPRFGLEWEWVRGAMMEAFTDAERRRLMQQSTDVFRTLIKTLLKAGIITDRTRAHYAAWVDMQELVAEGDRMVGDDIAEEGIRYLKDINEGKRKIVRKLAV
ncbi:MAG: ferritin-like domain-containing protein [Candidatus Binatia bacterium]